ISNWSRRELATAREIDAVPSRHRATRPHVAPALTEHVDHISLFRCIHQPRMRVDDDAQESISVVRQIAEVVGAALLDSEADLHVVALRHTREHVNGSVICELPFEGELNVRLIAGL